MTGTYFLAQSKHNKNGNWDKGIVIKEGKTPAENCADAKQSYHAYLGAYAYGHDANTDYVACYIMDEFGDRPLWEVWDGRAEELEEG